MRYQYGEISDTLFTCLPDGHRICWRGGLETDGEEHHLFVRMSASDPQAIEGRVNHFDVSSLRSNPKKIPIRTWHTQHVTEGAEDHARFSRNRMGAVDGFERSYADRATRPMHKLRLVWQKAIESVLDDRVRLPAAHFHQNPWAGDGALDLIYNVLRNIVVSIL